MVSRSQSKVIAEIKCISSSRKRGSVKPGSLDELKAMNRGRCLHSSQPEHCSLSFKKWMLRIGNGSERSLALI